MQKIKVKRLEDNGTVGVADCFGVAASAAIHWNRSALDLVSVVFTAGYNHD